ncbi:MAG: hypothetical protein KBB01_07085 [Candidatus Omnitrophica bacterium]|jgi:hypothetical protein|nr:hypothetical protein [Candidatus Omnitrophota bacterium]
MLCRLVIICWSVFFLQGCILFTPELDTLKEIGRSQKEINSYLTKQKKRFLILVRDVKKERLIKGMLKAKFLRRYGEPVLSKKNSDSLEQEIMLYRHPTKYFDSEKVYVHFDKEGRLIHWEYLSSFEE